MIGIIDSGVGGLYFKRELCLKNTICILDEAFFPYGNKSMDFLIKRTIYLSFYLKKRGVSKIILACNTLSIMVLDKIKYMLNIDIVGVFDLFLEYKNAKILCTKNTAKLIRKKGYDLSPIKASKLISLIQNKKNYQKELKRLKKMSKGDKILLGCTHLIVIHEKNFISQIELWRKKYNEKRENKI